MVTVKLTAVWEVSGFRSLMSLYSCARWGGKVYEIHGKSVVKVIRVDVRVMIYEAMTPMQEVSGPARETREL